MTKVKNKVYDLNNGIDAYFFYNREEFEKQCMQEKIDDAVQEATEKAKAIALAEGRAEGLEEGRVEGRKEEKLKNAKVMFEIGVPLDKITESLNMTEDEIQKIQEMIR